MCIKITLCNRRTERRNLHLCVLRTVKRREPMKFGIRENHFVAIHRLPLSRKFKKNSDLVIKNEKKKYLT